jgi:hypothetical protein
VDLRNAYQKKLNLIRIKIKTADLKFKSAVSCKIYII